MWTRIDKSFPVPAEVRSVLNALFDAGFDAYLVGGCVRDFLLARPIKDFDVATSARPEEVEKIFPKVIEVGRAFGVMKVVTESGMQVEVATFRKDASYHDHRRPSKVEFSDVRADAERRDFTINAFYLDLKTNQILDFFLYVIIVCLVCLVCCALVGGRAACWENQLRVMDARAGRCVAAWATPECYKDCSGSARQISAVVSEKDRHTKIAKQ